MSWVWTIPMEITPLQLLRPPLLCLDHTRVVVHISDRDAQHLGHLSKREGPVGQRAIRRKCGRIDGKTALVGSQQGCTTGPLVRWFGGP